MNPRRRPARRRSAALSLTPATWIAARARNALRRPVFIGAVSVVTFAASLLALVVVPQQARKAAAAIRPPSDLRPDTEPTFAALREAERQVATAEAEIGQARTELARLVTATAAVVSVDTLANGDTLSVAARTLRDSVTGQVAELTRLLARAENAPLLGSYRALAQAGPMQGDARVKGMLDSLVEIERERESFNAVGGVDPAFVALTARANELGRNIKGLAATRRTVLRQELALLAPAPSAAQSALAAQPLPDTLERIKARDEARIAAAGVTTRLAGERAELLRLDEREERARDLANVGASPPAMLTAALVFGAMLGFGLALLDEVRHPRVADTFEVERATGIRVLGVIRPLPRSSERGRRAADRNGPSYIDPGADGHQLIYLTIATASANILMLTITGDSPAVTSVIAVNFAAIAADEARTTLLIDTDSVASPVASALRMRGSAGMAGLVNGSIDWPEAVRATRLGRDRAIDVVPSGEGTLSIDEQSAVLKRDITMLARRYDAILVVSALDQALAGLPSVMPVPDVLYCARAGLTPIAELKRNLDTIAEAGGHVRGIVLWDAPEPVLSDLRPAEEAELEPATAG